MDHVCSICLGDMPGDTSLSLETAVEGDIVRHSSGRSGEVSIESSQVIVSFDGPNLSSEGWSVRPVVKLPWALLPSEVCNGLDLEAADLPGLQGPRRWARGLGPAAS